MFLKFSPEVKGTISRIDENRFRVTWDSTNRSPGKPRERFWFAADALKTGMEKGAPA